jgi:molybdenum cofactor guanylyltransferase
MTAESNNLYGLILAGGRSKRMGQDKSLLAYHGKPQIEYTYDLLSAFCSQVFISTRPKQTLPYKHLPQLPDLPEFNDIGPLGGILSAMTIHPTKAWLVLACDLPFITPEAVYYLIEQSNPQKFATAFISNHDRLPEPLCAIWEPRSREGALKFFNEGIQCPRQCPRKILIKSDTHLLTQQDPRWLDNVNNPEEYEQARKFLTS